MMRFVVPSVFMAVDKYSKPVQAMRENLLSFLTTSDSATARMDRSLKHTGDRAMRTATETGIAGAAILAPLVLATKEAVSFEDAMADVSKTTGLSGKALQVYGKGLLDMKIGSNATRATLDDLLVIGEIGGQLGVATDQLMDFTKAANIFSVALAKDYQGGVTEAITGVSVISGLFNDTKVLPIAEGINRVGSSINALGATGKATSSNITDFATRVGTLPGMLRPTTQATLAVGAVLEDAGIKSEIAASGFSKLLMDASSNIPGFASQMKMTTDAAKQLLMIDPTEFAAKFAKSVQGLEPDALESVFKKLSIGTNEEKRVIGALSTQLNVLTQYMKISNSEFAKGTSLINEYNVKNNTTAANIAKARGNMQAFAITIGTEVIPILNEAINRIMPIVGGVVEWAREHKKLTKIILISGGIVGGLLTTISLVNFAVGAVTKATWLWTAAQAAYSFFAGITSGILGAQPALLLTSRAAFWGYAAANYAAAAASSFFSGRLGVLVAQIGLLTGGLLLIWQYRKEIQKFSNDSSLGMKWNLFSGNTEDVRQSLINRHLEDPKATDQFLIKNPQYMLPGLKKSFDSADQAQKALPPLKQSEEMQAQSIPNLDWSELYNRIRDQQNITVTVKDGSKGGVEVDSNGAKLAKVQVASSYTNWINN